MFFPVKRSEWSPKFTSYWRGPFQILEKVATVLYKVNCGRSGSEQVIHTDRLRKVRPQVLLGESDTHIPDSMTTQGNTEASDIGLCESGVHDGINHDDISSLGRKRHKPLWHNDYVFSAFSVEMPNTKITPRTRALCPLCKDEVPPGERFELHVTQCAMNPKRHTCYECGKTTRNWCT